MPYTAIFMAVKIDHFVIKIDHFSAFQKLIFLLFRVFRMWVQRSSYMCVCLQSSNDTYSMFIELI